MENWLELNKALPRMSEKTLEKALEEEIRGRKRWSFIERLHQRLCKRRADREREELRAKFRNPDLMS